MAVISRGFGARRRESDDRLPPGQYLTADFPVLSAGPTPRVQTDTWEFAIVGLDGIRLTWSWEQLHELPIDDITTDIHCVTRWSKLGTRWRGVSLDHLLQDAGDGDFTRVFSYGGYTTNVPRADLSGGKAWIAVEFEGEPLAPEHGGPARLLVPHLYFWKSAKWVHGLDMLEHDEPGFWEQNGYNMYGDPWKEERYW
ncbi:molybdopterin-dependent oxidoreductase [Microbacterium sp. Leaf159]|uniref:molybdopterin-dependent oxidoreductase n=1 Tax=Microbacterium sp. Leaf159 TaxID=1736279 RepID=UPI0006F6A7F6|nr:molybdopterin-dependent oxidoreductase [Microbacterium sp. Leaf159]KQR38242.1 molybdopterin-binding protein [Microbacterium sp. Leaf159]